ncbi:hypothetical protein CPC08DRAFT_317455 [Agrocybe pediades]|nr:hypothetical protein CPC08DRAFT_317455 [Agrocybe pediades]
MHSALSTMNPLLMTKIPLSSRFRTLRLTHRFKLGRSTEGVLHGRSSQQMRRRMFLPRLCAICLNGISGLDESGVEIWQTSSSDSLLHRPTSVSREIIGSGAQASFKGALAAFNNSVKHIKSLDDDLSLLCSISVPFPKCFDT